MSRSTDAPGDVLNLARYVIAAMVLYWAFTTLLTWQREGWHTAASPVAQIAEGIAGILVLWRPRAGLIAALVPMGLTLWFGTMDADILVHLLVPAAFAAVARPRELVGTVGLFLAYAVARSLQSGRWEVAGAYLILLVLSVAGGLLLRVMLVARRRGQGGVRVMEEDARRIRGEERALLATELRSLVSVRLADSSAVLAAAHRLTDPAAMRLAIARVNETCLGALGEVRALVGILREDPMAAGQDESVAGPAATTSLVRVRDRLEEHGVKVRATVLVELDRASRVTQTTLTRVLEEIADAVLASQAAGAEVLFTVDRRRGWISMDAHYPDLGPGPQGHEHRMDRLRQRAEALGGSLRRERDAAGWVVQLSLPPGIDPPGGEAEGSPEAGWRRWLTAGTARGALTMMLTLGGLAAGAGLAEAFSAGRIPWDAVWEVGGFIAAGLLLWWPAVGVIPAGVAAVGMLLTPYSDDAALAAILLVACWQAAMLTQRWVAVVLGLVASLALIVTSLAGIGAVREKAIVAAVILVALPVFVAARHFLMTRRRQLETMAGLRRTTEGIRAEERNLLARELHDVVAHHLSVATLQSMAYGESDDPDELRTALSRMERSMSGAEDEMELLSRIMAGAGAEASGMALVRPTTVVGVLAETLRDNGFRVSVSVDPLSDSLPAPTLRTLTRVMQEGVTNILRYGRRDAMCRLTLTVHPDEVSLQIANALPARRRSSALSLGYGLAGIRERVDLLGGRFQVSDAEDTWVVDVALPHGV
ncbi:sensor histidine kinase [Tessaracoccus sp. G1721]